MAINTWPIRALRALVADTDEDSVQQLTGLLSRLGWQVGALKEGESVAEALRRDEYHVILLDLPRDEASAIAQLEQIRGADKDACVIAMAAAASVEIAVAAMRHSAFHFLQKPVDGEELVRVIAEAVRANGLCMTPERDLNSVVGRRVRERRTCEALTLREVARNTGLSVSLISQVELGKSAASLSTLHKLATALKVPMSHFVETL